MVHLLDHITGSVLVNACMDFESKQKLVLSVFVNVYFFIFSKED